MYKEFQPSYTPVVFCGTNVNTKKKKNLNPSKGSWET